MIIDHYSQQPDNFKYVKLSVLILVNSFLTKTGIVSRVKIIKNRNLKVSSGEFLTPLQ